jgi:hypothetical protein
VSLPKLEILVSTILIALVCVIRMSEARSESFNAQIIKSVAGVGTVKMYGQKSPEQMPIILFGELHNFPRMQLEEMLVLSRLQKERPVSSIVLEGMLAEDGPMLARAPQLDDSTGVEMVRTGALTAAEFMHQTRKVPLIPGDTHESWDAEPDQSDLLTCSLIGAYAAHELSTQDSPSASQALATYRAQNEQIVKFRSSEVTHDVCRLQKRQMEMRQLVRKQALAISALDPTLKEAASAICDEVGMVKRQINEYLQILAELRSRLAYEVDQQDLQSIDDLRDYLSARNKASVVIANNSDRAISKATGWVIAVIGDAHAQVIIDRLVAKGRSVAWVRFNSFKGLLGPERRSRAIGRGMGLPEQSGALSDVLVSAYSEHEEAKSWAVVQAVYSCRDDLHNRRPTGGKPLFIAKAEFHSAVDQFAKAALGTGGSGDGGEPPSPRQLPMDDPRWHKKLVHVDTSKAIFLGGADSRRRSVVFPVIFLDEAGQNTGAELWVGARLEPHDVTKPQNDASQSLEALIAEALKRNSDELEKSSKNESATKSKDQESSIEKSRGAKKLEPIRISMDTRAVIGKSKDDVMNLAQSAL